MNFKPPAASAVAGMRIKPQTLVPPRGGHVAIQCHEVIRAVEPIPELIPIVGTPAMPRLALRIDHPQTGRRVAQVAEHAKTGTHGRFKVGTTARVTDGRGIAADPGPALIQEQPEVTATG